MPNEIERLADGFINLVDGNKDLANVARLRGNYAEMVSYFGGREHIPSSVIKVKRTKLDKKSDPHSAEKSCAAISNPVNKKLFRSKTMQKLKYITRIGSQRGALSKFPQDFARQIILFYSKPGDIVIDPFAGHNSRMEATVREHRCYFGQDLHKGFMDSNRDRARTLLMMFSDARIMLREGDSRKLKIEDGVGDFGFTCPPYWKIERYDKNDPKQLENAWGGYEGFLVGLGKIMKEHYRTLKPGAYCVWVVNYFRWKKKLIRFHDHTKDLAEKAGFELVDEIILDHGRAMRDAFFPSCFKLKIMPKRHEYALVFRKPKHENS